MAWEIPKPGAQPADVRPVPEPGQREDRLLPAGQGTRPVPGADLAAVICQQPGHEHGQLERDVKDDTIRQHAEPPGRRGIFGRDLLYRGLRAFPGISCYVRVSARMGVTPRMPGSRLPRKPDHKINVA